jgi:hypothetical protein
MPGPRILGLKAPAATIAHVKIDRRQFDLACAAGTRQCASTRLPLRPASKWGRGLTQISRRLIPAYIRQPEIAIDDLDLPRG